MEEDLQKAREILEHLNSYIKSNSERFNQQANRIVYALFGSAWASIFVSDCNNNRFLLIIVIGLSILYFFIDLLNSLIMERLARKLHQEIKNAITDSWNASVKWDEVINKTSYIQIVKMHLIMLMVVLLGVYFCITKF